MRLFHFWKIGIAAVLFTVLLVHGTEGKETAAALGLKPSGSQPLLDNVMPVASATGVRNGETALRNAGGIISRAMPDAGHVAGRVAGKQQQKKETETVSVIATGYTAGYESTGKRPNHPQYGITYSGVKVRRDKDTISTIAADLNVFPLGTVLYIPGYGYGVVADKGSAIKGNKLDLYFSTTRQVFDEWGKKRVEVRIIKKGSGKLTEQMMKQFDKAIEVNGNLDNAGWEESI